MQVSVLLTVGQFGWLVAVMSFSWVSIAQEGMPFNRCYVTNSICGPSRAVIQTGKYGHLNGFIRNGNQCNGDQQTFLDIAGETVPQDMQGHSLVPLCRGEEPEDWRKTFYYHYYGNPGGHNVARHYGVTNGRYKLMYFYALEGQAAMMDELHRLGQLYQVPDDPDPGLGRRIRILDRPKGLSQDQNEGRI